MSDDPLVDKFSCALTEVVHELERSVIKRFCSYAVETFQIKPHWTKKQIENHLYAIRDKMLKRIGGVKDEDQ